MEETVRKLIGLNYTLRRLLDDPHPENGYWRAAMEATVKRMYELTNPAAFTEAEKIETKKSMWRNFYSFSIRN